MSPSPPGPSSSRTWTRLALLALPLTLLACEDTPVRPSSPAPVSAFKDGPSAPAPSTPEPPIPVPTEPPAHTVPAAGSQPPPGPPRKPEQLFTDLGCVACHGEGRPFAPRLTEAHTQPDETVAMWILDPQKVRPGALMPGFVGRLTTAEALSLARWIKAGNPASPGSP